MYDIQYLKSEQAYVEPNYESFKDPLSIDQYYYNPVDAATYLREKGVLITAIRLHYWRKVRQLTPSFPFNDYRRPMYHSVQLDSVVTEMNSERSGYFMKDEMRTPIENLYGMSTSEEVAEFLGIPESRVIALAKAGVLPHYYTETGAVLFHLGKVNSCVDNILIESVQSVPKTLQEVGVRRINPETYGTGVYFLFLKRKLVYVGQTTNLTERLRSHRKDKEFDEVFFYECEGWKLNSLEGYLIRKFRPILNKASGPSSCIKGVKGLRMFILMRSQSDLHDFLQNAS